MGSVSTMDAHRHRETIGVLRHLLQRAERGEIGGLAFIIDDLKLRRDVAGVIGSLRASPGRAANSYARQCIRLSIAQDEIDAVEIAGRL